MGRSLHLRMASGNEPGTNDEWIPGGFTSGGVVEAIVDMLVDPATYCIKPMSTNEPGEFCYGRCPLLCDGNALCEAQMCDNQCKAKCTDYSSGSFACATGSGVETDIFYSCAFESPAQPRQCYYGDDETDVPYSGMCTYYRESMYGATLSAAHAVNEDKAKYKQLIRKQLDEENDDETDDEMDANVEIVMELAKEATAKGKVNLGSLKSVPNADMESEVIDALRKAGNARRDGMNERELGIKILEGLESLIDADYEE